MKMYEEMMTSLIMLWTHYVDWQYRALSNNDDEMARYYQHKTEKIEILIEKLRDKMMK